MTAAPSLSMRVLRSLLGVMGTSQTPGRIGQAASIREFAANPLAAAGILAPSALYLGGTIGAPIGRGAYNLVTARDLRDQEKALETAYGSYADNLAYKLKNARQEQEVQRNMMAVQQASPHLYAQVMAGRRLPQGSVVLGGQPRQDLMEELASYMGSLPDPDPLFQ